MFPKLNRGWSELERFTTKYTGGQKFGILTLISLSLKKQIKK